MITKQLSAFSYGCIYKITNSVNDKCYVGQTIQNPDFRFRQHLQESKYPARSSCFHRAIKKYGKENFNIEILIFCKDQKSLNDMEDYMINHHKALRPLGYTLRGSLSKTGVISEEMLKKMSDSHLGKIPWNKGKTGIFSKETLLKISNSKKGSTLSKEAREKISKVHKGRKISEEQRAKISRFRTGIKYKEETRRLLSLQRGSVRIKRDDGVSIKIYECLYDVVLDGFTKANVQQAMVGFHGHNRYKGYVWTTIPKEVKNVSN